MKTIIKSAIIFSAFALLSTGAFAANKVKTDTLTNEATATVSYYSNTAGVDVNIDKATQGDAMITLYDADGNVVLNDKFTVDTDTVKKSYLLTGLTDGDYTLEVATGTEVTTHTIQLSSDAAAEQAFAF
ncbi:MAG: hypothetical protein V4592_25900 [Bacteroidota bacterium]